MNTVLTPNRAQEQLQQLFLANYGYSPQSYFFAPGRVNLIGEHLDYNGGYVFPCTLDLGTYAALAPRQDQQICAYSHNFPELGQVQFNLDALAHQPAHGWVNYIKGVIASLQVAGYPLKQGFNLVVFGNLPQGAGLSSSASLEVLMAIIIKALGNYANLSGTQLAHLCQKAENEFIGVNCGIMDQFVIANNLAKHALLLNCANLEFTPVALNLAEYSLVIANSNKQRTLADSKYNQRYHECQQALAILQQHLPITNLCQLTKAQFAAYSHYLTDPILRARARHVVTENERVLAAVAKLQANDLSGFGHLMTQSHCSLRDDYAVTGHELDSLVAAAWQQPGCLGSRMTGAGFGGATVSLVVTANLPQFIEQVAKLYQAATGLSASFYAVTNGRSAAQIA